MKISVGLFLSLPTFQTLPQAQFGGNVPQEDPVRIVDASLKAFHKFMDLIYVPGSGLVEEEEGVERTDFGLAFELRYLAEKYQVEELIGASRQVGIDPI